MSNDGPDPHGPTIAEVARFFNVDAEDLARQWARPRSKDRVLRTGAEMALWMRLRFSIGLTGDQATAVIRDLARHGWRQPERRRTGEGSGDRP